MTTRDSHSSQPVAADDARRGDLDAQLTAIARAASAVAASAARFDALCGRLEVAVAAVGARSGSDAPAPDVDAGRMDDRRQVSQVLRVLNDWHAADLRRHDEVLTAIQRMGEAALVELRRPRPAVVGP